MKDTELDRLSVRELTELRARIDATISMRQAEEKSALKEKFRLMAEEVGLTVADVVGPARAGKGTKVAIKYINPDNPQETWTGRGRPPRWLAAKLNAGAELDDFKV